MAILNFPTNPALDQTYIENDVIYTWNGEYWEANTNSGYDSRYVEVSGDNMTGDLTLGPVGDTQLTLTAASGSITAAGLINSTTSGGRVTEINGDPALTNTDVGNLHLYCPSTDPSQQVFRVFSDIGGTAQGKVDIKADGSARFAGNIQSNWKDGTTFGCELASQGLISVRNDIANDFVFRAYKNTFADDVAHITNDGSATFKGLITGSNPLIANGNSVFRAAAPNGGKSDKRWLFYGDVAGVAGTSSGWASDGSIKIVGGSDGSGGIANAKIALNADGSGVFQYYLSCKADSASPGAVAQIWTESTGGTELGRLTGDSALRLGNNGANYRIALFGGTGNAAFTGSVSKGSGSFNIPHPLPALKDTHRLVHSFIEGPQADNIYRGQVTLENGVALIDLDVAARMTEGTFVLLNTNLSCFTSNETDWVHVRGSVSGSTLTIEAQDNTSTATVSWMVVGERHDEHMLDTAWTDENGRVITEPLIPEVEESDEY